MTARDILDISDRSTYTSTYEERTMRKRVRRQIICIVLTMVACIMQTQPLLQLQACGLAQSAASEPVGAHAAPVRCCLHSDHDENVAAACEADHSPDNPYPLEKGRHCDNCFCKAFYSVLCLTTDSLVSFCLLDHSSSFSLDCSFPANDFSRSLFRPPRAYS